MNVSIDLNQSCQHIYDALRKDPEAELRRNQLLEGKISTENFHPANYSDGIGSFDATSCLGCIFTANKGQHVVSFHHDGRYLGNLVPLFQAYKGQVVQLEITGGVQKRNEKGELSHDYKLVDKEFTQENFKSLINFARQLPCKVDLKSWTIGDNSTKEGLVCEYLAQPEGRLTLLETGSIYHKCLPQEFIPRYTFNSLMHDRSMLIVYDSDRSRQFHLEGTPNSISILRGFAKDIQSNKGDRELLAYSSTTPELEPPYFCDTMRKVAEFVLSPNHEIKPNLTLPQDAPCILLQGEAGRICKG